MKEEIINENISHPETDEAELNPVEANFERGDIVTDEVGAPESKPKQMFAWILTVALIALIGIVGFAWMASKKSATTADVETDAAKNEEHKEDETGKEVVWDGKTMGELQIRGPWIASSYYNDERSAQSFMDGWFRTGDVISIDPEGYIQIVDRTKDLVKSGGEWISTVELESAIMAHPKVLEAAVIAVPHVKWQERPLALVVPRSKEDLPSKDEIYDLLAKDFAKWQFPDDVVFVEAIPKTSVGKFDKKVIRESYKEYQLPE